MALLTHSGNGPEMVRKWVVSGLSGNPPPTPKGVGVEEVSGPTLSGYPSQNETGVAHAEC